MALQNLLKAGAKKYAEIPHFINKSAYEKSSGYQSNPYKAPPVWRDLPVSSPSSPSPSAGPGSSVMNFIAPEPQYRQTYTGGSEAGSSPEYSYSDAELWNMQLENAYLMKALGYDVDFQDGEMVYSRNSGYEYSPYGAYGYADNSSYYYGQDYYNQYMPYDDYYYQTDYYSPYDYYDYRYTPYAYDRQRFYNSNRYGYY